MNNMVTKKKGKKKKIEKQYEHEKRRAIIDTIWSTPVQLEKHAKDTYGK